MELVPHRAVANAENTRDIVVAPVVDMDEDHAGPLKRPKPEQRAFKVDVEFDGVVGLGARGWQQALRAALNETSTSARLCSAIEVTGWIVHDSDTFPVLEAVLERVVADLVSEFDAIPGDETPAEALASVGHELLEVAGQFRFSHGDGLHVLLKSAP